MKGYVVTLFNLAQSMEVATRCIESGKKFNVDVVMFPAVYKDISENEMEKENLKLGEYDHSYSNVWSVVGNFISQYRIWKLIAASQVPGVVLEHDAVFVDKIPELHYDIINLGKPSYGSFERKNKPGIYSMFSKGGGYIPGAHGYFLTPTGAGKLVRKAKEIGIFPCDLFLNKKNFPEIMEVYPWCIEVRDSFTTIQKEKGCKAKHNYSIEYGIL